MNKGQTTIDLRIGLTDTQPDKSMDLTIGSPNVEWFVEKGESTSNEYLSKIFDWSNEEKIKPMSYSHTLAPIR